MSPLEKGKSKAVKEHNLKELLSSGYPPKQAEAIMYSEAGEKREKAKKRKPAKVKRK